MGVITATKRIASFSKENSEKQKISRQVKNGGFSRF